MNIHCSPVLSIYQSIHPSISNKTTNRTTPVQIMYKNKKYKHTADYEIVICMIDSCSIKQKVWIYRFRYYKMICSTIIAMAFDSSSTTVMFISNHFQIWNNSLFLVYLNSAMIKRKVTWSVIRCPSVLFTVFSLTEISSQLYYRARYLLVKEDGYW